MKRSGLAANYVTKTIRDVITASGLLTCGVAQGQNWVPNPGFEEADTCIHQLGPGGLQDWYSAYLHFDRLQACLAYGSTNGLPMNAFTFQDPFEGGSCIGLFSYHLNGFEQQREWAMVPLLQPLEVGQMYYCSFRANAAFGGNAQYPTIWLASSNIGMLFTTYDRHWYQGDAYPAPLNMAHVLRTQVLSDTVGWTLVSGSFVADSAYSYLMIGNFFSNALTDTLHFADPDSVFPWYPWGYTLIDAVCVSPKPMGCDLGQDVEEVKEESGVLFPNPASDQLFIVGRTGAEYQVLDALGRAMAQGRALNNRWGLDVGAWPPGAYIMRLATAGRMEVRKFVVAE
ncbi:MAG: T9SS type A sorting domain-containing protein [Flavobacteriales bacterium]|nr:T9SS type A sorting domain-containing protein [Flavobacteriales bacterium]